MYKQLKRKATCIILTLLTIGTVSSCRTTSPEDIASTEKSTDVQISTQTAQSLPTETKKPKEGKVKGFFLDYGREHKESVVLLKTRLGDIEIQLYDETPIHRANFIYNIQNDLYHKTIFYRVVPEFMIQGGNSDHDQTIEKRQDAGAYYIPNETKPHLIHKRGAIAMAMSYQDNPDLKSAQYSYYIVLGKKLNSLGLDAVEKEYSITIPPSARDVYEQIGGSPHLDGVHTVFGEVIRGMDVVEAIASEKRDSGNWPIHDVVIDYEILR